MMEQKYSAPFLRKRKFMLVLPLLVLPFITLAFWSLGGGRANAGEVAVEDVQGLNTNVPDAQFKREKTMDKLQYYEQADRDSNRLEKMMRQDPYYSRTYLNVKKAEELTEPVTATRYSGKRGAHTNKKAERLLKELEGLQRALAAEELVVEERHPVTAQRNSDTDRIVAMMQDVQEEQTPRDPQLEQMDQMLDKILKIQNPQPEPPVADIRNDSVYTIGPPYDHVTEKGNGFWGLEEDDPSSILDENHGIQAVVHEDQVLISGATVKLRLLSEVSVGNADLKAGQYVFGRAQVQNERLQIDIPSVQRNGNILPVKWKIYDMDGLEGIYIPGSIDREVIQQSGSNGLQSLDLLGSVNPSLSMQAASLGIQTAKSLIGKKVKMVKVQVKAGYKVLIRDVNTTKVSK